MAFNSKWAHDEDRFYRGVVDPDGTHRIFVEQAKFGLTERYEGKVLRELQRPDPVIEFHWGYAGSGPNNAAQAILINAFGWDPPIELRHAFVWDWLAVTAENFLWRRPTILRWARGWLGQSDVLALRAPLAELPPIEPDEYQISPEVRERRERRGR